MFKILVSDKFSEKGLDIFRDAEDAQVDYTPGLSPEELIAKIGEYDALVVRSATNATSEVIAAAGKLKVIGRAGVGVDNIDQAAATRNGIVVMNTPGGNNRTTAEHTIAMLLALSRNIPAATASLKSGKWEKPKFIGKEVLGKTLGVIGLGNIGAVVARLGLGLNMKVLGYDPFVSDKRADEMGISKADLNTVFEKSDYITVHVPKNDKTTGLINDAAIAKMKQGVRILNCARGGIVDEAALIKGLESGKVAGAALDVFAIEPPGDHPLLAFDNVVVTPHLGASTVEAQDNVAVMVAEQILDYLRNGTIINSVNVPSLSPSQLETLGPFLTLGKKLGNLLGQLVDKAPADIRILFGGDLADMETSPIKAAALQGFVSNIAEVEVNAINAAALAADRGIDVEVTTRKKLKGYAHLIGLEARFDDGETLDLQGAIINISEPRLVRYNGLTTDMELEGDLLIMKNHDRPGVVGEVGCLLGNAGINIANLRLARNIADKSAVLMVAVDSPAPKDVLEKIRTSDNIIDVRQVRL